MTPTPVNSQLLPLVLVIDDDPMILSALRRLLGSAGYAYRGASSGEEGLELARSIKPDAILLDVSMPGLDGRDVLVAIQRDAELRSIPVFVITASADQYTRRIVLEAGAEEVVEKPFDPVMLERRMAWTLEKRRREFAH